MSGRNAGKSAGLQNSRRVYTVHELMEKIKLQNGNSSLLSWFFSNKPLLMFIFLGSNMSLLGNYINSPKQIAYYLGISLFSVIYF